jgi:hypothetical protein
MILYVVKAIKLDEGVTEKVWFELDTVGDADICTQLLKLSDDTGKVPEQLVFAVFVVTEVTSISSEKVTETDEASVIPVALSAGLVELTVGATDSVIT